MTLAQVYTAVYTLSMTTKQIAAAAKRETLKHDLATKIRELLDAGRAEYGAKKWDDEDVETTVIELVASEDDE